MQPFLSFSPRIKIDKYTQDMLSQQKTIVKWIFYQQNKRTSNNKQNKKSRHGIMTVLV